MTSRAYGACGTRSPHSQYDVILIVTSFATELAMPAVMDVHYGHLTAFNIYRYTSVTTHKHLQTTHRISQSAVNMNLDAIEYQIKYVACGTASLLNVAILCSFLEFTLVMSIHNNT